MRASLIWVVLSASAFVAACEDTGLEGDGGRPDAGTPLPAGLVKSAKAGESIDVNFESPAQKYLVVAYSLAKTQSDGISFSVKVEGSPSGTGSGRGALTDPRRPRGPERDPRLLRLATAQMELESWRRRVALRAAQAQMQPPARQQFIQGSSCQRSSECGEQEVCLGATKGCSERVDLDASKFPDPSGTYSARVAAKGQHVAILVDSDVASAVPQATVTELLEAFDRKIYPRDVALFGNPPLEAGGEALSTDRNGDGLVWVVLTPRVSGAVERVGFFFPTDFTEEAGSNRADILYAMPPGAPGVDTQLIDVLFTMAHEFQHMLSFANKVYRPRSTGGTGALEALWLDEGLSHLAEDLCGFGSANLLLLQQETLSVFSGSSLIPAVDEGGNQIDSRPMRGMALLFLRYLFERKGGVSYETGGSISDRGGASWLQAIHNTSKQGREAIEATYGDFKTAFERWLLTVALDNRGVTDAEVLNYDAPITDPTPPGGTIGFRFGITLTDPSGDDITLERPLEDELAIGETDDVVASTSGKFFLLSGIAGTAKVTVSSDDSDFFFDLVQLD